LLLDQTNTDVLWSVGYNTNDYLVSLTTHLLQFLRDVRDGARRVVSGAPQRGWRPAAAFADTAYHNAAPDILLTDSALRGDIRTSAQCVLFPFRRVVSAHRGSYPGHAGVATPF
jgi:hypothetical protein